MKIIYIFCLLCLMACTIDFSDQISQSDVISNEIIIKSAEHLKEKYGLSLCGIGGGGGGEKDIRLLAASFYFYHSPLSENEAREFILDCINIFLEDINSSEVLRPYLINFPFTAKNIAIRIVLADVNGNQVHYPYIDSISAVEDRIMYLTRDPEKEYGYKTDKTESYEEAVNILRKEKQTNNENALENESNLHVIKLLE